MPDKVLVPGKFVVLHAGHIRIFRFAKEIGQVTIAALDISGLNKDEADWRVDALSSLEFVDEVKTFEDDISNLILSVKPEIILKGREFANTINPELQILNTYGGKLIFSSGTTYYSGEDSINSTSINLELDVLKLGQDYLNRNNITKEDLLKSLDKMANIRTCVIGDIIVDEIINCHPVGMSQEDPAIVVTPIDSNRFIGGAGIVAGHCNALGSKTTLVTVLGNDTTAEWCKTELNKVVSELVAFEDIYRKTTLKQRFRSGKQVLFKLNHFEQTPIQSSIEDKMLEYFTNNIKKFDLIIFSDFSYGVISIKLAQELIKLAKQFRIPVVADSQTSSQIGNLKKYVGVSLITPTELEARNEIRDQSSGLAVVAQEIRASLETSNILLKLGADGVLVDGFDKKGKVIRTDLVPSLNKNPIDTSGAGDSMLAGSAIAFACGDSLYIAAFIGSIMSAIQVSRIGNSPISKNFIQSLFLL